MLVSSPSRYLVAFHSAILRAIVQPRVAQRYFTSLALQNNAYIYERKCTIVTIPLSLFSLPVSLSDIPIPFNPRFRDRTTNASDPDDAIDGISSSNNLHGQVESFLCTFFQSFHYAIKIVRVTRMMMIALLRFRECNVYKMLGMWVSRLEGRINAITGDLVLSLLHVYIYNFCLCFSKNVARISHNASCIRDRLSFHSPLVQSRSL